MSEIKTAVTSYIKGLADISAKLITRPAEFFKAMPKNNGYMAPLLYVVIASLLGTVLSIFISMVARGAGIHYLSMAAIWLIIVPMISVILSFFAAGICYVIWNFTGSKENFETSYRCLAYTHVLMPIAILLSIVPYLGLLGIAWWLFIMVVATKEVHKASIKPALIAFGIIAALAGLTYYNSVSSALQSKKHLEEFTRQLQQMPGSPDLDSRER